jgi:hypothetical protein
MQDKPNIKIILYTTVLAVSMLCCSVINKKSTVVQEGYAKIQFDIRLPYISEKGIVTYIKDTVILYFNQRRLIYRLPYLADKSIDTVGDTITKYLHTQYNYYFFKDTLSNGYRTINEYKLNTLGIANWDSINKQSKWYGVTERSKISKAVYAPYKRDTAGAVIRQTLVLTTRETAFDVDTVLLIYGKKHTADHVYSFFTDADTIPGYKLVNLSGTFNPLQYQGLNIVQRYYGVGAIFSAAPTTQEQYILDSLVKKLPAGF